MSTRSAKTERQRLDILEAAAPILAERGFHGMSMRDLAATAGCGLSSLYNYFESKEALLAALQVRAFETLVAAAEASLVGVSGGQARLYAFISNHVRYFIAHVDVMRVLIHEAAALPGELRQPVRALKTRYFELGRSLVGEVSEAKGAMLDRAAYNVFGMLNWVWAWYEPETHGTALDVARSVFDMAVCGLEPNCPFRELQDARADNAPTAPMRSLIRPLAANDGAHNDDRFN